MIGFRGWFCGKQYCPKKPVKWGIKTFTIADSKNGYLLDTLVYTGADTQKLTQDLSPSHSLVG